MQLVEFTFTQDYTLVLELFLLLGEQSIRFIFLRVNVMRIDQVWLDFRVDNFLVLELSELFLKLCCCRGHFSMGRWGWLVTFILIDIIRIYPLLLVTIVWVALDLIIVGLIEIFACFRSFKQSYLLSFRPITHLGWGFFFALVSWIYLLIGSLFLRFFLGVLICIIGCVLSQLVSTHIWLEEEGRANSWSRCLLLLFFLDDMIFKYDLFLIDITCLRISSLSVWRLARSRSRAFALFGGLGWFRRLLRWLFWRRAGLRSLFTLDSGTLWPTRDNRWHIAPLLTLLADRITAPLRWGRA